MKNTITINGRLYDATTGLAITALSTPIADTPNPQEASTQTLQPKIAPPTTPSRKSFDITPPHAANVHQRLQKSHTLVRGPLKKPSAVKTTTATPKAVTVVRSPQITKFGPANASEAHHLPNVAPTQATITTKEETPLRPPVPHPVVTKALERRSPHRSLAKPPERPSVITTALHNEHEQHHQTVKHHHATHKVAHRRRTGTVLAGVVSALVLSGYITYLNLPSISLRVAAARAGIAATLPTYTPEGYKLTGPVAYQPGEVSFQYRGDNGHSYSITQQASTWDEQAVLDNYVSKQAQNYLTYQDHGLTIYSFNNQAAWVNGGILYTVSGNTSTHLSSDQLLNIVSSL